jgi:hypothetical protein
MGRLDAPRSCPCTRPHRATMWEVQRRGFRQGLIELEGLGQDHPESRQSWWRGRV